ncbi:MAG: CmcJ/NvfI family oxidoreductase [Burkholderiales bacterium]
MPQTASSKQATLWDKLPSVRAPLSYIAPSDGPAQVRVYPPSSGIATERPSAAQHVMAIRDVREVAADLRLDEQGFELHSSLSAFTDFYDAAAVRERYYPEVEMALRAMANALTVIAFDHNVRSAIRAARGETGIRVPVDQVHNDYTEDSGPKRRQEILAATGRLDLMDRRVAFVNLWRPIIGPVQDNPLALCSARSVAAHDLVPTDIHHFGEDDLTTPRHTGQIYSVRHNPAHEWFYVSEMQPDEVLLLKCYDSLADDRARFMPHTGFINPNCPNTFVPRESIEVRTLVVFAEPN